MSFYYSDDPIRDFEQKDRDNQKKLERKPVCCLCEEHIQDEYAYRDGEDWYCEECKDGLAEKLLETCREQVPKEGD